VTLALADLDEGECLQLRSSCGIGRVIDLRTPVELAAGDRDGLAAAGVAVVHLPVAVPPYDGADLLVERYFEYLARSPASVVAALDILSRPGGVPTVVFCTSGKDRTGVVVALLLRLVGVTEDAVVADYRRSAPNIGRLVERLTRSRPGGRALAPLPPAILQAEEATMRAFLAGLEHRHGGVRGWTRTHGVPDETIGRLEEVLLGREREA
jgi:hypothetical protein